MQKKLELYVLKMMEVIYPIYFRHVKAIGWYMEEFDCAQVSTNITDIAASPIIEVFYGNKKKWQKEHGVENQR